MGNGESSKTYSHRGEFETIKEIYYQKQVIDWIRALESKIMIPVHGHRDMLETDLIIKSYLIPRDQADKEMETDESRHGSFMPGFTQYGFGENSETVYLRFGNEEGVEPLISEIYYDGLRNETIELAEEFRQLYTLFYDPSKCEYVHPQNENHVVCKVEPDYITIDKKYLKSYLAAKDKDLVLCIISQIQEPIIDFKYTDIQIPFEGRNIIGSVNIGTYDRKNYSQLYAKAIIEGCLLEQCNLWPFNETKEYVDFIIGIDKDGNEIMHSCNPNSLSNYFGSNPGESHYLTPVFFDRTVLEKYVRQPETYYIEPGLLRCGKLWSMYIDNESPDYISAYLGDLGRNLPSVEEQQYWRNYNKVIDGKLSRAKVNRDFYSVWSTSEAPDIIFKCKYHEINEKCKVSLGWTMFLELSEDDKYNFTMLRIPLRESQEEFDGLVLSLVKVLIDSLNEKEILKQINNKDGLTASISKLERWFEETGLHGYEFCIKFLRNLQELRSTGTGHRKGKGYEKIRAEFGLDNNNYKSVYAQILRDASAFIQYVDDNLNTLKGENEV